MSATIGSCLLERIPHNLDAASTIRLYRQRQVLALELEASLANSGEGEPGPAAAFDPGPAPDLLPGQLWTFEEVCQRLRICKRTLFRLIQREEIRPTRITPGIVCFQPAEVERFVKSRTQAPPPAATADQPQLVDLGQMAAMIHRSKRSLERYREQIPGRLSQGGRGAPAVWDWTQARGWLEQTFGLLMPERYPGAPGFQDQGDN